MKSAEWCWFLSYHTKPNGPFPSRDKAIADANESLSKGKASISSFYVAPCLRPTITECLPKDNDELAGYILEALDNNCEECFRDPNEISFALAGGARVKELRDFVTNWVQSNVIHQFLVPDIANVSEVSRTCKSK